MVEIKIDFDFDDAYAERFERAGKNQYTLVGGGTLALDDIKSLLEEGKKTKIFQDKERLGFLKIYDDGELVGLSVPRVIDKREHAAWCLPLDKTYYRMGMIFIDEPYRGKGIAKDAAYLFKDQFKNLVWTIDPSNEASKKVADYIGLTHNTTLYINGAAWKHTPWKHNRMLEVWSN